MITKVPEPMRYPRLFSPLSLGGLELPNRIVMAPMGTHYADLQHRVTDRLIAYHVARARGGTGLNIVEHTAVHPLGLTAPRMLAILDDTYIDGFRRLADAVHEAGGRIALQLQHGGRQASVQVIGQETLSPSAVPTGRDGRLPREMTVREIREAVEAFGEGARRARQAGLDGVEVHMAHGYLGCSFLSPHLNRRTDAYGGDLRKRTRFAAEVIAAIRKRCGQDFPVWCRVSAEEYVPGGMTPEMMQQVAVLLQGYGYCAIHVSAGIGETSSYASAPFLMPQGHLLPLAAAVARVVSVPVIGVGNLRTPARAEEALSAGQCHLVALGRALLADPEWANKARQGRERDIITCVQCNLGCLGKARDPEAGCECVTNPTTGHEAEWEDDALPPAEPRRKVLVIGGGPAGMTAAAVAARRGHEVTLWEQRPTLGGRLADLVCADRSGAFADLLGSMVGALDASGVQVLWQQKADWETIAAAAPDVVVIATGSRPATARESVVGGVSGTVVDVLDCLQNPQRPLSHVVTILGAGESGCLAALHLARRGHEVTLLEREPLVGPRMAAGVQHFVARQLADLGVKVYTACEVLSVAEGTVTVRGSEGVLRSLPAGSVVLALGHRSQQGPAPEAAPPGLQVYSIGDCVEARTLHHAIWEGAQIGRTV
ncbi:MAG: FAD-dependent oxidoreductase [Armatimonadia bacterium]